MVLIMTPEQVIKFFEGEQSAAAKLGVSRQIVNYWKRQRRIPTKTQAWIQLRTGGKLKAENGK